MSMPEISGFEMIEKLGQGGMATVWKARQLSLDRIVAIKILSAQFASDPEDIQMFQKEAQSAAKLKHLGIVQVYDANAENGMYFFVMEYVAGYTVGDWARRKGSLSETDALLVAECVADALEYAWDREQIIHCDIKPDNIIIDSDGTVKLADLGLARTLSAMSGDEEVEEVMGTPAYIAPEQAMGEPDIDFRADIYSLGAMLYHLVTGQLLFEGYAEEDIMEMQVNDTVPDPIDINPELSKPLCWLIEKMLCKGKEGRQSSWGKVREDIARVKRGLMPAGHAPASGESTVDRSNRRSVQDYNKATQAARKQAPKKNPVVAAGILGALLVVAVAGFLVMQKIKGPRRGQRPPPHRSGQGSGGQGAARTTVAQREAAAREMFSFAKKWQADNPDAYNSAIQRFRKVASETRGTKYSLMADDEVSRLTGARDAKVKKIIAAIKAEAEYFVENQEFDHAAGLFTSYSGACVEESRAARTAAAQAIMSMKAATAEEARRLARAIETKTEALYEGVARELVSGGISAGRQHMKTALSDSDLVGVRDKFTALQQQLDDAANIGERIMASFKKDVGKRVTVALVNGRVDMTVLSVNEGLVEGESKYHGATVPRSFSYEELDLRERLMRMGSDDQPEVALVKGLMALSSGAFDHARRFFAKTDPSISKRLIEQIDNLENQRSGLDTRRALQRLVRLAGLEDPPSEPDAMAAALDLKKKSQLTPS